MAAAPPAAGVADALAAAGIQDRFHPLLAELCGDNVEFLADVD
eukprot:gene8119-25620_t